MGTSILGGRLNLKKEHIKKFIIESPLHDLEHPFLWWGRQPGEKNLNFSKFSYPQLASSNMAVRKSLSRTWDGLQKLNRSSTSAPCTPSYRSLVAVGSSIIIIISCSTWVRGQRQCKKCLGYGHYAKSCTFQPRDEDEEDEKEGGTEEDEGELEEGESEEDEGELEEGESDGYEVESEEEESEEDDGELEEG